MKNFVKLVRVKHYLKNGLIMLPLIFSGQLFQVNLLVKTLVGFLSFCSMSSVIYIINDIFDAESDRRHPVKCRRPIANGVVSVRAALFAAAILLAVSFAAAYISGGTKAAVWGILLFYFVLNIAYSAGLKNIPILDVAILASGFLLRLLFGSAVSGINSSYWLCLTVISMSFFLGLGKRRNELIWQTEHTTRKVLTFYNRDFLDKNMYLCLALTIAFYSLWCVNPGTAARIDSSNLIWTVPLVILICMKYSLTIEGTSDGDPVEIIFKDKVLLILVVCFTLLILGLIYWK